MQATESLLRQLAWTFWRVSSSSSNLLYDAKASTKDVHLLVAELARRPCSREAIRCHAIWLAEVSNSFCQSLQGLLLPLR